MSLLKTNKPIVYYSLYFSICLICIICFSPVIYSDSQRYILYAQDFLGNTNGADERGILSPFYSMILSPFILVFGETGFAFPVMCFQYLIIFISAILVKRIGVKLNLSSRNSYLLGLISILLPSTLQYGYFILSEVITYFLFILMTYLILVYEDARNSFQLLIAGLIATFMVFSRFNMLFIPLMISVYIVAINVRKIEKNFNVIYAVKQAFIFLLPLLITLNLWSYRNLEVHGFFFPFARMQSLVHISGSLMLLSDETPVRPKDDEVKQILLAAKKKLQSETPVVTESSLLSSFNLDFYQDLNIGSRILGISLDTLYNYYGISENRNKRYAILFEKLKPLHESILSFHKKELLMLRVFSMTGTFRLALSTPPEKFKYTLNLFPSGLIKIIKLIYIMIYPAIILVLIMMFLKERKVFFEFFKNFRNILLISLISYFPIIMFITADPENSARFKYPSEILVIVLSFVVISSYKTTLSKSESLAESK